MSTKTPAQLVRQITLSLLLLSAIIQALTILTFCSKFIAIPLWTYIRLMGIFCTFWC